MYKTLQRTAIIGYGKATTFYHTPIIQSTPGLMLQGIASSSAEKRALLERLYDCKSYVSFEAAIADPDVDLIFLATPNATHADLSIRAMEAGKHVVTEKVMCLTLAECDRMIETAERTGRMLSVFQNRRWDGDFLTVRQLMDDGRLGTVNWVEMAWQRWDTPVGWRAQKELGGGRFYDLGAHLVDQLVLLFPQAIQSVFCRMYYGFPDCDVESHALIVVEFDDHVTGVCDLCSVSAIAKPRFHLFGTAATFIKYGLDPQDDAARAGNIDSAIEDSALYGRLHNGDQEQIIPTLPGRWRTYYENISNVLNNGAEPAVKLHETRRTMLVLDAALRSAQTNQVIKLEST